MRRCLEVFAIVLLASAVARADTPRPKTCPVDYKHAAGKCALGDTLPPPCEYPEGHCECYAPSVCSGLPQRKPPPLADAIWHCTPKVRADGCPGDQPAEGTACSAKKLPKACAYGTCGGYTLGCVAGKWKITSVQPPPP